MWYRSSAALAAMFLLGAGSSAFGQERFRIGGGAGFAVLQNPEINHGRTAVVGGSLGIRLSDNFTLEGGFSFARSDRQFDEEGTPIDQLRGAIPDFQFEANRYHLDATVLIHLGRRQPFHPYVLAGAGFERVDENRTNFTYTFGEDNVILDRQQEVVLDTSDYHPAGHLGAGFDLYFLYNVAARVEFRLWLPQDMERRTRMFFFGANYYF